MEETSQNLRPDTALRSHFPPAPVADVAAVRVADYADRAGYDPEFLGNGFSVPMPLPADRSDLVAVSGTPDDRAFELRYVHFSVVMSRSRRLCVATAVNIDGAEPFFRIPRPGWRNDPRIPAAAQLSGDEFYVPEDFDRGHMVRRLDPVWGTRDGAQSANRDTHHYTNACPQAHSFNDGMWGDLEDSILGWERTRAGRATVVTGPVLRESDPVYRGIRVPVQFYKIVAVVDDATGLLAATAFRLDQSAALPTPAGPPTATPSAFPAGRFAVHQVSVGSLAALTGIDFGPLRIADVFAPAAMPPGFEPAGVSLALRSPRDIVFPPRG